MSAKANLLSLSCLLVVALIGYGTATLTAQPQPLGDVSVRVFNSVPQVVGDFYTPLTFDSELWDTANLHTNPSTRLVAPVAGKYLVFGHIVYVQDPAFEGERGYRAAAIRLNGQTVIGEQRASAQLPNFIESDSMTSVATHYQLNVGDYVELLGSVVGSNVSLEAVAGTAFGMVKVP